MNSNSTDRITYFAETDYRNQRTPFGVKAKDRSRHMYVIGKTGMGKSTMLENMAVQDIQNGEGMAFIDPHGAAVEKLLSYVPEDRIDDVVYFAPFDLDHPIAFNIMEDVGYDRRHLVANGLMSAFKKIWVDAWSARMEYILNNAILALLEYPDATLLSVNKMLTNKKYREKVVDNITDPSVASFWKDEFANYSDRYAQEATPAIQNKIGQFTSNPLIRNIVGQPKSSFDLRKAMDEKKIILMNMSKGQMGEQNAQLLGSMLVTKIYLAAMSRADLSDAQLGALPNFYFYVDEFQSFANESFADILSEARKYKLNLVIAHQYVEQMPEEVRAAVFGNVGSMVTFRVGAHDAEVFEKEFMPRFEAQDIVNLGFAQIYLRLMIDGIGSQPFSAVTMPPIAVPENVFRDEIIARSRQNFAMPREVVSERIDQWLKEDSQQKKDDKSSGKKKSGKKNIPNEPPGHAPPPPSQVPKNAPKKTIPQQQNEPGAPPPPPQMPGGWGWPQQGPGHPPHNHFGNPPHAPHPQAPPPPQAGPFGFPPFAGAPQNMNTRPAPAEPWQIHPGGTPRKQAYAPHGHPSPHGYDHHGFSHMAQRNDVENKSAEKSTQKPQQPQHGGAHDDSSKKHTTTSEGGGTLKLSDLKKAPPEKNRKKKNSENTDSQKGETKKPSEKANSLKAALASAISEHESKDDDAQNDETVKESSDKKKQEKKDGEDNTEHHSEKHQKKDSPKTRKNQDKKQQKKKEKNQKNENTGEAKKQPTNENESEKQRTSRERELSEEVLERILKVEEEEYRNKS